MRQYTKEAIQQLLDRFMDGTSTIEEEDVLSEYFAKMKPCSEEKRRRGVEDGIPMKSVGMPEEWEDYRLLFAEIEKMKPKKAAVSRLRWWWGTAAAIVVGVMIVMGRQYTERESLVAAQHSSAITQLPPKTVEYRMVKQKAKTTDEDNAKEVSISPNAEDTRLKENTISLKEGAAHGKEKAMPQEKETQHWQQEDEVETLRADEIKLMAQIRKDEENAERELEESQQVFIHAQMLTLGFIAVKNEDSSMEYVAETVNF